MTPAASAKPYSPFLWIAYSQDPLLALSQALLSQQADKLPNLSAIVIILNEPQAARSLRRCLLDQAQLLGYPALLAPRIESLADFVSSRANAGRDKRFCDNTTRELILIEALQQHPLILGKSNPWVLAEHLLSLFDELTLNQQHLPEKLEDFTVWLQQRYQVSDQTPTGLSREAELIHTLWLAWHAELEQRQYVDRAIAYTQALQQELDLRDIESITGQNQYRRGLRKSASIAASARHPRTRQCRPARHDRLGTLHHQCQCYAGALAGVHRRRLCLCAITGSVGLGVHF